MLQKNKACQILRKKNVPHPYIRIFLTVSGGEKCLFFGKFVVFCFLVTAVLRFAILFYYRRTVVWNSLERIFLEKSSLQMLKLFLNFIRVATWSLKLKLPIIKLESWFVLWLYFLLMLCFIIGNLLSCLEWDVFVRIQVWVEL